jgi:UDP-N-acetylmuramoyl-tripeptide--D-alanyl-D-alanine ligase
LSIHFVWSDAEVRRALGLTYDPTFEDVEYTGVCTDTRALREGELYVALAGERFDGHEFVADAMARGARGAVVSRPPQGEVPGVLYVVDDTLIALGRLASYRRQALPARVVGITGSAGKTGTKDLTAAALGGALRVHATRGNLNNRVGVPLTLLSAPVDTEVVVAEMGTNLPGEIALLAEVARPEVGVVTNIGESHLEGLGSVEGVLAEKLSLLEGLTGEQRGVVGDSPPELPAAARRVLPSVRVAGWTERAEPGLRPVQPVRDERGVYSFSWKGQKVSLGVPGRHAVVNALLALAVAEALGVEDAVAVKGVTSVRPADKRGQTLSLTGLSLIVDCYNANPQSVLAAAEMLADVQAPRRVAFLGTMLELGEKSASIHARVLNEVLARDFDIVVATGAFATAARSLEHTGSRSELLIADDPDSGYDQLWPKLDGDEAVLLKASRGVALERLVPRFQAHFGDTRAGAPTHERGSREPGSDGAVASRGES